MSFEENEGSESPLSTFARLAFGAMYKEDEEGSMEFESFHMLVTEKFQELANVDDEEELLSIAWIQKLLKAYISCQDAFTVILKENKLRFCKAPLNRFAAEFFEMNLKGLDFCNVIRDCIERIRTWHKDLDIMLNALYDYEFIRLRRSLKHLTLAMLDEEESASAVSQRNLGRLSTGKDQASTGRSAEHGGSHSRNVSQSRSSGSFEHHSTSKDQARSSRLAQREGSHSQSQSSGSFGCHSTSQEQASTSLLAQCGGSHSMNVSQSRSSGSFSNHSTSNDQASTSRSTEHGRFHSWSVSQSWSAAKQLHSISSKLNPPLPVHVGVTGGLLLPVSTMNYVLVFVLWVLVAVFPCQDRGLQIQYTIPTNYTWGTPLLSLYDRILDESKKRDRKNSRGLLKEIFQTEKFAQHLTDIVDTFKRPLTKELLTVIEQEIQQLTLICDGLENGLDPLELQVKDVYKSMASCRIEGLDIVME